MKVKELFIENGKSNSNSIERKEFQSLFQNYGWNEEIYKAAINE